MAEQQSDASQTLDTIFHEGLELYNKVTNSQEPTNSPEIQRDLRKAIQLFEQATRLVSLADVFSSNEELEELATNDIQYLLLPALLGLLTAKITTRNRKEVLDVAEVYYKDFLRRTNQYKLSNYKVSIRQKSWLLWFSTSFPYYGEMTAGMPETFFKTDEVSLTLKGQQLHFSINKEVRWKFVVN